MFGSHQPRSLILLPIVLFFVAFVAIFAFAGLRAAQVTKPNIVFFIIDDLGWADVGFHGSDIYSPNIDALAAQGIILNNYYVQYACTPTRAALMTGRYPIRYGLQHDVLGTTQVAGLNLTEVLLPTILKSAGYATRLVGKWHLGFYQWAYTPTYRGWDHFYGFYNGLEDHYYHTVQPNATTDIIGYDLRRDTQVDFKANGTYGTYLFTQEAVDIITTHNQNSPLFLLVAHQNNHSPLQVPDRYLANCSHIQDENRKLVCGMMAATDESVLNVTNALKAAGMWQNTLFVFSTDNGGIFNEGGYNYPLRGCKFTLWEGGVRASAFMYGNMLPRKGIVSNTLMHVTDWLPTFVKLSGAPLTLPNKLDGYDVWKAVTTGSPSPRTEILLNIDPRYGTSAIREGDWKLVNGTQQYDGYFTPPGMKSTEAKREIKTPLYPNLYLFNITADPNELNDVADANPDVLKRLMDKIADYQMQSVPPVSELKDYASYPSNWGGVWTPWLG